MSVMGVREKCDDRVLAYSLGSVRLERKPKLAAFVASHSCAKYAQEWGTPCVGP
jgi:hypothetical protein